jgi:hypothetical protein
MRRLVPVLLTIATAPAFADTVAAPTVDTEPLRGNVLVWHDAALYSAPSDDASTLHVALLARREVGHVVPMHVVAMRGAFVEVEFAGDAGCTWSRLATGDDIAKLHLFVKRTDLAPVVTKPFEKTFADGTRIKVAPGAAVVPINTSFAVSLLGHGLEAEVPAASVAHSYQPGGTRSLNVTDKEYLLAPGTRALLGTRPVTLDGVRAQGLATRGDTALVTFEDACVSATVAVPAKAVVPAAEEQADIESGSYGHASLGMRDGGDYFPKLTALSSASGRQIAYAAKPIYLMGTSRTKTTCIDRRVRIEAAVAGAPALDTAEADDRLRLCAPTAKVVHEKLRSARSASGSTSR